LTDFVQTNKAMHKTRAQIKLFAQIPLIFVRCKISMHKTCLYLKSKIDFVQQAVAQLTGGYQIINQPQGKVLWQRLKKKTKD
jgi:hypothetical protein